MSSYRILTYSGSDPALAPYIAMIHSDFKRSLRYGNAWYKLIDSGIYFQVYGQIIDRILGNPHSAVKLAVLSDDPDICLGWSLFTDQTLHYVYVKGDQRGQGIGRELLPSSFSEVTHLTTCGQSLRKSKFPDVIFNPFF